MAIVVLEGIDGVGKTALIKQLQEKYPDKIETLAFPTVRARMELDKIHGKTLQDDITRHIIFEMDFMHCQYYIDQFYGFEYSKGSTRNTILLLDRWFPSNIAYSKFRFKNHGYLGNFYDILITNISNRRFDALIILKSDNPIQKQDNRYSVGDLLEIQKNYTRRMIGLIHNRLEWQYFVNHKYYEVDGLQEDTFEKVETILKEKGYLN